MAAIATVLVIPLLAIPEVEDNAKGALCSASTVVHLASLCLLQQPQELPNNTVASFKEFPPHPQPLTVPILAPFVDSGQ